MKDKHKEKDKAIRISKIYSQMKIIITEIETHLNSTQNLQNYIETLKEEISCITKQ